MILWSRKSVSEFKIVIRRSQVGIVALNTELYSEAGLPAVKWLIARNYCGHFRYLLWFAFLT